ncbi:MAG: mechanosensitive ion channel family protein [Eggerthellaceae bacterium]
MLDFFSTVNEQYPVAITIAVGVIIVFATWIIERVVYKAILRLGKSDNNGIPASSIFANIARVTIWLIGIAILFKSCFNYDVTGLVAALGIGGIALSLGMQDTLSNLIGGLQVSLGRIIEPGQYVQVLGQEGRVRDVSWRHTTIVDAGGNEHLIPNSLINKNSLTNVGESVDVRASFALPVGADIKAFSEEATTAISDGLSGKLGSNGVRIRFTGEDELGSLRGNAVADVLRSESSPETATDLVFRYLYPVLERYSDAESAVE